MLTLFHAPQSRSTAILALIEEMGIQDGDTVSLYNLEFEYQR